MWFKAVRSLTWCLQTGSYTYSIIAYHGTLCIIFRSSSFKLVSQTSVVGELSKQSSFQDKG